MTRSCETREGGMKVSFITKYKPLGRMSVWSVRIK